MKREDLLQLGIVKDGKCEATLIDDSVCARALPQHQRAKHPVVHPRLPEPFDDDLSKGFGCMRRLSFS